MGLPTQGGHLLIVISAFEIKTLIKTSIFVTFVHIFYNIIFGSSKKEKEGEIMPEEKKITKEMSILEIVQTYPETIEVFARNGLGCIGCAAARFENLEAGAKVHGIDPDKLVEELNAVLI